MRVVRDQFAHIDRNGTRLHTKVRVLVDDTGRVAVFLSPKEGPQHVYNMVDVVLTKVSGNCSHPVCHGKANRSQLTRLWEQTDRATTSV